MTLRWSEAFLSNNLTLDEEHAELFRLLNRLESLEPPDRNVDPEEFQRNVEELLEYTTQHCSREEQVMSSVRYPGHEAHAVDHTALRASLIVLLQPVHAGRGTISIFSKEARSLFLRHFQKEDLAYLRWVGEQSGQPRAEPGA